MAPRSCTGCSVSISEDDYLLSTLQRGESLCSSCLDAQRLELVETRVAIPKLAHSQVVPMHDEVRSGYVARLTPLHFGLWLPVALAATAWANSRFHDPLFTASAAFGVLAGRGLLVWIRRLQLEQYDQERLLQVFRLWREKRQQKRVLMPRHLGVLAALLGVFCLLNPSRTDFDQFQPNRRGNVSRRDFVLASMFEVEDPRTGASTERRYLGILGTFWELPT